LRAAMRLFWKQGYMQTNYDDLVRATGVNRASLYAAFGDKKAIFTAALKMFDERRRAKFARWRKLPPEEALHAFFADTVQEAARRNGDCGCFVTNTALELAPHDAEIRAIVTGSQQEVAAFLEASVAEAQKNGAIASTIDPHQAACALLATLLGMRVLARSRPQGIALDDVAAFALNSLGLKLPAMA